MRILLVEPAVDTCYEYVSALGLMNLFLIGKKMGFQMEFLDLSGYPYERGLPKLLSRPYDIIGISCNFTNAAPYCIRYVKDIKQKYPGTLVIAGGNHATLSPVDLLYNGYDYIIYGEGEETFREFIEHFSYKKYLNDIKGIYYLEKDRMISNPAREAVRDLDELPFNDYSEFNLEPYFKWAGMRYINIETSRGCVYNCSFCATVKMWGRNYRHKSPRRIVEEFKVARNLECDFVFLVDDDTALNEENLHSFCELLIRENVGMSWGTTIGSVSVKQASTFDLMAKAGCVKVNICIESANPRLLREYRKPYGIEDNKRTCAELRKRGILVHNHGIIGSPGETLKETMNTYLYLIKTSPMWHISILEPRPGNDYWKKWDKKGDIAQYRLFGKANVILSNKKNILYLIYRVFALCYFINPSRIWNVLFSNSRAIRYSYRIQYYVAYRTIKSNLLGSFCKNRVSG